MDNYPENPYYIDECFFTRSLVDILTYYLFTKGEIEKNQLVTTHFCICLPIDTRNPRLRGLGEWIEESILDPTMKEKIQEKNKSLEYAQFENYSFNLLQDIPLLSGQKSNKYSCLADPSG